MPQRYEKQRGRHIASLNSSLLNQQDRREGLCKCYLLSAIKEERGGGAREGKA
jgi:hypothetical protein